MKTIILFLLVVCQLACLAQDDVQQRIDLATKYILDNPQNARLYIKRANLYIGEKNYEKARKDLAIATEIEGESYQAAVFTYAELYNELGQYQTALEYIDKFLEINPIHLRSFRMKAGILENLGDADRAIDYYKKVIVHTKQPLPENYLSLINLLERQERYTEALFYCQAATRQIGNIPELEEKLAHLNPLTGN